jgi:uncharacterized iron-regulated membrane protein
MSAVPGSVFRRTLFWAHLACGVTAGLLILLMSFTGVLLAYEHQLVEFAARHNQVAAAPGASRLDADALAAIARSSVPAGTRANLVFDVDPAQPVTVQAGRQPPLFLDPYTGKVIEDAAKSWRGFFQVVENWHRWMGGESRSKRASLMDIANLLFVFIIASGIYLWLPAVWRWRTLRGLMLFQWRYVNSKVRDFNWHHVFSFWMLVPLFLIALSGVVISYGWASNLVYTAFGEQAPQRGGPPGGPGGGPGGGTGGPPRDGPRNLADAAQAASLQSLFAVASAQDATWRRITLPVNIQGYKADITIELPATGPRAPRRTLVLDAADASVVSLSPPPTANPQTPGQRARTWFRFVHTGEQYGIIGQTLAAIASLAACFLAYTGIALAWRRLVWPLLRREA